jgi:hypothetical protein
VNRNRFPQFLAVAIVAYVSMLPGCGSSSSTKTTPPITVTISSKSQSVFGGQSTTVSAATNDPKGVTWSLTGPGSLSGATATTVTYNSPGTISTAQTATVTAASVSDAVTVESITITIAPTISVGVAAASPNLVPSGSTTLTATTNDTKGVTWTLSGSGSLSDATATTAAYTAPSSASSAISETVTATSVSDTTKSASVTIKVSASLTITTNLPAATFTLPYMGTVQAAGGVPPYTITLAGTLPTGLTFSNGVVSGTPAYPGNNGGSFSFTVTDSAAPPETAQTSVQSLHVNLPTSLTILTSSLPNGEVGASYSQNLNVTGGTPPYSFSISAGTPPPNLGVTNVSIAGTPTTTGTYSFTVKVTDFAIPPNNATTNLSITILPPVTITTTTLPGGTVGTVYAQTVQATGGMPPYGFSASSSLPSGFNINSSSGAIAGVPAASGISNFTVSVGDTLGGAATSSLSITIAAANCPNNSNFQGNYAYQFTGPDIPETGANVTGEVVGSFIADGSGNMSQGYLDYGGDTETGLTGTYCIGANNVGTLIFPLTDLPTTFLFTLDSSGNANVIRYENAPPASFAPTYSGILLKQDTTAFSAARLEGNYTFGLVGGNTSAGPAIEQLQAGTFSSNGTGDLTGEFDTNGIGGPINTTFTASDFAVAPFGRGTATLNEPGGGTVNLIFYVVNSSRLLALAQTNAASETVVLTGPVVQTSGGPFTTGSLNGASVIGLQANDVGNGYFNLSLAEVGLITWDGAGNFVLTADQNSGGTLSTSSYSGTYSVASDGRVSLTVLGYSATPVFYMTALNQAFFVGTETNAETSYGQILAQSGGPFSNATFSGAYLGLNWPVVNQNIDFDLDDFTADGAGNLSGTAYAYDYTNGPSSSAVTATYSVSSSGRGVVMQSGSPSSIFYVVSPTQVLLIPSTGNAPQVTNLSHP